MSDIRQSHNVTTSDGDVPGNNTSANSQDSQPVDTGKRFLDVKGPLCEAQTKCVCKDKGMFQSLMSLLSLYERKVKAGGWKSNMTEAVKILGSKKNLDAMFAKDFPFYLILAFRMHSSTDGYQQETFGQFILNCCERFRDLQQQAIHETLTGFLRREDFEIPDESGEGSKAGVFKLLEDACVAFSKTSGDPRRTLKTIYTTMAWISVALKCHWKRGPAVLRSTSSMWQIHFLHRLQTIKLTTDVISEVKNGLNLGSLLELPMELTFCPEWLGTLLTSKNNMQQLAQLRDFIVSVQDHISLRQVFVTDFLVMMRGTYSQCLEQPTKERLLAVCSDGTPIAALKEGLGYLDVVYSVAFQKEWMGTEFSEHVEKWLSLLCQLVDVSDSRAHECLRELLDSKLTVVVKFSDHIRSQLTTGTNEKLLSLPLEKFTGLYRDFSIWETTQVEKYFQKLEPAATIDIVDTSWEELLRLIQSRARHVDNLGFLLDFLKRVAEQYSRRNEAIDFVTALLKLNTPWLFSALGEQGGSIAVNVQGVRREFAIFLKQYIERNSLNKALLDKTEEIWSNCSTKRNDFQGLALLVIAEELISDITVIQNPLSPSLDYILTQSLIAASKEVVSLKPYSAQDRFSWAVIAACCNRMPVEKETLSWVTTYASVACRLPQVYQTYCHTVPPGIDSTLSDLCGVASEEVAIYFKWVLGIRRLLSSWKEKFSSKSIQYNEIKMYKENWNNIHDLGDALQTLETIINRGDVCSVETQFQTLFEKLNVVLIKYLPGDPNAKWCNLMNVLSRYGVILPHNLQCAITEFVALPLEDNYSDEHFTSLPIANKGEFRLSEEVMLKLSIYTSLKKLASIVQALERFTEPLCNHMDMLVYFSLQQSQIFATYLEMFLTNENALTDYSSSYMESSFEFEVLAPALVSDLEETPTQELILLQQALRQTKILLQKLGDGTATYKEVTANHTLDLKVVKLGNEVETLSKYFEHFFLREDLPKSYTQVQTFLGSGWVKCMLELFEITKHVRNIHTVIEKFNLTGCLNDPNLQQLVSMCEALDTDLSRSEIKLNDASYKMDIVRQCLCLEQDPNYNFLEIFPSIADSKAFYEFLCSKKFAGREGQERFSLECQFITAQLQHGDYNDIVLNHLISAYEYMVPFLDSEQNLHSLMLRMSMLDASKGCKQLETVNRNIDLIKIWFSKAEGDTVENVLRELHCVLATGHFQFTMQSTPLGSQCHIKLEYQLSPPQLQASIRFSASISTYVSLSASGTSTVDSEEEETKTASEASTPNAAPASLSYEEQQPRSVTWTSDQITDFVRKLGFLEASEREKKEIEHFQKVYEVSLKLADLYLRLKRLGHPEYLHDTVIKDLPCDTSTDKADREEMDTRETLAQCSQHVTELHQQYEWLMFFSVAKVLSLFQLLNVEPANGDRLVEETMILLVNTPAARESLQRTIQNVLSQRKYLEGTAAIPMPMVGRFLAELFSDQSLEEYSVEKQCFDGAIRRQQPACCWGILDSTDSITLHHSSWQKTFSQYHLVMLVISLYDGAPEPFQVFHCKPSTTEEELHFFFKRVAKYPLPYLVLQINRLPFQLQEMFLQLYQENVKDVKECKATLHLVESSPSVLREMPWIMKQEHKDLNMKMGKETVYMKLRKKVLSPQNLTVVELVYGAAGAGKSHQIAMEVKQKSNHSVMIAVNEAFTLQAAITKLCSLPKEKNCSIVFNFTRIPPQESMAQIELYQQWLEVVQWFFFSMLILGYIEDPTTGVSFLFPSGLEWRIYIEVPSQHVQRPQDNLTEFKKDIPVLGILGVPHFIHSMNPFSIDPDVRLVCKYLKAYQLGEHLLSIQAAAEVEDSECLRLLKEFIPDSIRGITADLQIKENKTAQRLFFKYLYRRCAILNNVTKARSGQHRFFLKRFGEAHQLEEGGNQMFKMMLEEVSDICQWSIKHDGNNEGKWTPRLIKQLIYGSDQEGNPTFELLELDEDEYMKTLSLGETKDTLFHSYLSHALGVPLNTDGRLSPIDDAGYLLTLDYTVKMLHIHERSECGVPVIIEGETGVGKTALVEMLSRLWNHALLSQWKMRRNELVELLKDKIGSEVIQSVLDCGSETAMKEDLLCAFNKVGQVNVEKSKEIQHKIQELLMDIRNDSILRFLELEIERDLDVLYSMDTTKAIVDLTCELLTAKMYTTFYKLNVHSAVRPEDILDFFHPVITVAKKLQAAAQDNAGAQREPTVPYVTVFLDEVNTSSCMGLMKEIVVDGTMNGEVIPDNVFIIAACNPHRANSLATLDDQSSISLSLQETWVRGSYYVQKLPPTLHFLIWDYEALNELQEREYIRAKLLQLNEIAHRHPQRGIGQVSTNMINRLTHLIAVSHTLMRGFARDHFIGHELDETEASVRAQSYVSQRDIQRLFTFYEWLMKVYKEFNPHGDKDYNYRAVLVSLALVYYLRLNTDYRERYREYMDSCLKKEQDELKFSKAIDDEINWFFSRLKLPPGIAQTEALKENVFVIIVCTMTHTPLIIVGPPGCSKTLSFHLALANLKGEGSKVEEFQRKMFHSLDPHFYQCSRRTTSLEIETVFKHAIHRQQTLGVPIYCVVFMDEAGLPEEKYESLKVLHQYLDSNIVSFVAITNRALDAAKSNRAVTLFRPETTEQDLNTLARGCFCSSQDDLPLELQRTNMNKVTRFCPAYSSIMRKTEFQNFFGLRDFIHFIRYLHRKRAHGISAQVLVHALERNFNGVAEFEVLCQEFLGKIDSSLPEVQLRNILDILKEGLEDRPLCYSMEHEVRYKIIIDPSEDDSLARLLFTFRVLNRTTTRMLCCSSFLGNTGAEKINAIASLLHSASAGHTVLMYQTDEIHESFYNLFNQNFRCIEDPLKGSRYFTNVAIGPHTRLCLVHPLFQCVVIIKQSEVLKMPPPFLNRFEKFLISHNNLVESRKATLSPLLQIILAAAHNKVDSFLKIINRSSSIYGLRRETLDSLVLSMLPPWDHKYVPITQQRQICTTSSNPAVMLLDTLLNALREERGFHIIASTAEELANDAESVFNLVTADAKFAGCLANLTEEIIRKCIDEALNVLHYIPPSGADPKVAVSKGAALVIAVLQQWLIRYMCKSLMQLMTPEALALHQQKIPISYRRSYLLYQDHFSLKDLITKYWERVSNGNRNSPNKLLCYTRSSGLIHNLPLQYPEPKLKPPSSMTDPSSGDFELVRSIIFSNPEQLSIFKLLNIHSQSNVKAALENFIRSERQILLLLVNMKEIPQRVVNELRIMIEEVENIHLAQGKMFALLLHFPPVMFTDPCYPSLYLHGWGHYYLDTIAVDLTAGCVDIRTWFTQCCTDQPPMENTLTSFLPGMMRQAVAIASLRLSFGTLNSSPFNKPMPQQERNEKLESLLVDKPLGSLLQSIFQQYWDQGNMTKYLQRAAGFTRNGESSLNMTDCLHEILKSSFLDFLLYMLSRMNDSFNLDVLFNAQCPAEVYELFRTIVKALPIPDISELKVTYNVIKEQTSRRCVQSFTPKFPFFKLVSDLVDRALEQSQEEINQQLNVLDETQPSVRNDGKVKQLLQKAAVARLEALQDEHINCFNEAMLAITKSDELWERYFTDFTHHKLQIGCAEDGVSHPLMKAVFESYIRDAPDSIHKVVALHVYFNVHQLELAKVAILLRSLNQMKVMVSHIANSPSIQSFETDYIRAAGKSKTIVGESSDLTVFITNTLFTAMATICTAEEHVLENLLQWYRTYNRVMSLPAVKKFIYTNIPKMPEMEAKLNVMNATFASVHLRTSDEELQKSLLLCRSFISVYFSVDSLKLKGKFPHLAEVVSMTMAVMTGSAEFNNLQSDEHIEQLMEQLLAHFFSEYHQDCHEDDIRWFLTLSNQQFQWKECQAHIQTHVQPQLQASAKTSPKVVTKHPSPRLVQHKEPLCTRECIPFNVFKFFLARLLLARPVVIRPNAHPPRSYNPKVVALTKEVLTRNCTENHGPYVPLFYHTSPSTKDSQMSKNQLMQQPLAHLYFAVVWEHLFTREYQLADLTDIAAKLGQQYRNPDSDSGTKVLLSIEKQAVIQLILKTVAQHLDSKVPERLATLAGCTSGIKKIISDEKTHGGVAEAHGMVLALHLLKYHNDIHRFVHIMTVEYQDLCEDLEYLRSLHKPLKKVVQTTPHLFPFMVSDHGESSELNKLYQNVCRAMKIGYTTHAKRMDQLKQLAKDCNQDLKLEQQFQMMLWLCSYNEFFKKKKVSVERSTKISILIDVEEQHLIMLQCLLNPALMQQPLRDLFVTLEEDDSLIGLQHFLVNLVAVIICSPPKSNHLWFLLFSPKELTGLHIPGFMYDTPVDATSGGPYSSGTELTPTGMYAWDDYSKYATKGVVSLHSLYVILLANFGAIFMGLLLLPDAEERLKGTLFSNQLQIHKYCASMLTTIWKCLCTNLGITHEDCCFLLTSCMKNFQKIITEYGCFSSTLELREGQEAHEGIWHSKIFQPAWIELQEQHCHLVQNEVLLDLRQMDACYPHCPSLRELAHNVFARRDLSHLSLLAHILLQQPLLQAGSILLPTLIEFYQWLHTDLAYLIAEDQVEMLIGDLIREATRHYYSASGRKDLTALYKQLKDAFVEYNKVMDSHGSSDCGAVTKKSSAVFTISDDTPLVELLSHPENPGRLFDMIAKIIKCHNDTLVKLEDIAQLPGHTHFKRYIRTDEVPIHPMEFKLHTSIMGQTKITDDHSSFKELIGKRFNHYSACSGIFPDFCGTGSVLELPKVPKFNLHMIQEDVAAMYVAGKPVVQGPSSLLRTFCFKKERSGLLEHGTDQDPSNLAQDLESIDQRLPQLFKENLSETDKSQLEFSFHSLNYHMLHEVAAGLSASADILIRVLGDMSKQEDLQLQNLAHLLMLEYDEKQETTAILNTIGIQSLSSSQMKLLLTLGLPFLFNALQMFVRWIQVGQYDFHTLPFILKSNLNPQDVIALQQICDKIDENVDLVNEINTLMITLNHTESSFIKMIIKDTEAPIRQYLREHHSISEWDKLTQLIPDTVLIKNYVPFRIELRRLLDKARKKVSTPEQEAVLWDEVVPETLSYLCHKATPMHKTETPIDQIPQAASPVAEKEGLPPLVQAEHVQEQHVKVPVKLQPPALESQLKELARNYTVQDITEFLQNIGMEQYAERFTDYSITGDSLLDPEELEETLRDLGVERALHQLKILVGFKRKLMEEAGATPAYDAEKIRGKDPLAEFLKKYDMPMSYQESFISEDIDWELLLYVMDDPLKETLQKVLHNALGEMDVTSGIHKRLFKRNFKAFVDKNYL